mmetsp:Transcript_45023/g.48726  ORF Transcript_45023/g.48726 Transcript_45023/m.48726 type:complete len:115 (+) Transcript_45023:159-503(+)
MRERPMEESIQKYTRYSNDNEIFSDDDDDDDEIVQVQPGRFEMFGTQPNPPPIEESISPVMRTITIKVKPTTKPIPTRVLNKYACFTNNNDDDDLVSHTEAVNRVPTTVKPSNK